MLTRKRLLTGGILAGIGTLIGCRPTVAAQLPLLSTSTQPIDDPKLGHVVTSTSVNGTRVIVVTADGVVHARRLVLHTR